MSDWGLGKKLNSQIEGVPLNHLIWLNDYKTYGEDSYVFQNKDMLHELYKSGIAPNDGFILIDALEYVLKNDPYIIGKWLSKRFEFTGIPAMSDYHTLQDCLSNIDVVNKLLDTDGLLDRFIGSHSIMNALTSLDYLNNVVCTSKTFMDTIEACGSIIESLNLSNDMITLPVDAYEQTQLTTLENIYVKTVSGGNINNSPWDGSIIWSNGSVSVLYRDSSDESTVATGATEVSVNKFVKKLTLTPANYNKTFESSSKPGHVDGYIQYIQLDNMV